MVSEVNLAKSFPCTEKDGASMLRRNGPVADKNCWHLELLEKELQNKLQKVLQHELKKGLQNELQNRLQNEPHNELPLSIDLNAGALHDDGDTATALQLAIVQLNKGARTD